MSRAIELGLSAGQFQMSSQVIAVCKYFAHFSSVLFDEHCGWSFRKWSSPDKAEGKAAEYTKDCAQMNLGNKFSCGESGERGEPTDPSWLSRSPQPGEGGGAGGCFEQPEQPGAATCTAPVPSSCPCAVVWCWTSWGLHRRMSAGPEARRGACSHVYLIVRVGRQESLVRRKTQSAASGCQPSCSPNWPPWIL